jgi:hypothetical protein
MILALGEIAAAIKRASVAEDLDPYWADFVARIGAIDFAVSSAHPDEVELLQGECELAAAAILENDKPELP